MRRRKPFGQGLQAGFVGCGVLGAAGRTMRSRERGETVERVTMLKHEEVVRFDPERVEELYTELGEAAAEDVVCRALEEMAACLSHAERCHREARPEDMRSSARGLAAIAGQLGMLPLARVAGDVAACAEVGDPVASAATLARLLRLGERSLGEVQDMRDVTL